MATEIRAPEIGATVTKASIGRWFKRVGDPVSLDEPLVEIETDGGTIEVPSSRYRRSVSDSFDRRKDCQGRYVTGNDYRVLSANKTPGAR